MTTPTREQVIEQAIQGHASTRMAMQWLYEHALKEGRDQGLREAKEVCEVQQSIQPNEPRAVVAACCAAAIEQLRGE
jgi:uncharacterized paraquat-inducible protein A